MSDYSPKTTQVNPEARKAVMGTLNDNPTENAAPMWKATAGLKLYFGGEDLFENPSQLIVANITHVLTIMPGVKPHDSRFAAFNHMIVPALDSTNQDLLQYFPRTNEFIQQGLDTGNAVLVHCSAGISRSTTCVIAYLMSVSKQTPKQLLARIRKARTEACPNEGFLQQLDVYYSLGMPKDIEHCDAYHKWLYEREIETKVLMLEAPPDSSKIWFSDEHIVVPNGVQNGDSSSSPDGSIGIVKSDAPADPNTVDVRCRKCRRVLANSKFVITHTPADIGAVGQYSKYHMKHKSHYNHTHPEPTSAPGPPPPSSAIFSSTCAHLFLEPLSWMRAELSTGKLEGRLECPNVKCGANVGKYAWQGMPCSCREWVVPAISLSRAKVDVDQLKSKGGVSMLPVVVGVRLNNGVLGGVSTP